MSEDRAFGCGLHALRGVLLRQANDAETGTIAHFWMRLFAQDALEQLGRVGAMARAQFTMREGVHSRWA
jgi:hypothetical protein